jgi:branched-chain amino acid aminotransferase
MKVPEAQYIWFNGKLVRWGDAKIHVLTHALHYGSAVFEGMRCYSTEKGPAAFRIDAHLQRMMDSAKIYRMAIPYSVEELKQATFETVLANKHPSCYVRPIAFLGYGEMGIDPRTCPVDVAVATWEWGRYLGADALVKGVDVCVSSWRRPAPDTFPSLAKASANYLNSQLIKLEALDNGYAEGIALDIDGHVSEGSGENLFLVRRGKILTPPMGSCALGGITRDCVIALAKELGYAVEEEVIPREMLYVADEMFLCGTAAEMTPIRSVDHRVVGSGSRGPITEAIQDRFFAIVAGKVKDEYGWLTLAEAQTIGK